jgi:monoamine oxidase
LSFLRRLSEKTNDNDPGRAQARRRALAYVVGFNAADPNRVGVHWLVQGMRAEEKIQGHRAFRPAHGYEDLLSILRTQVAAAQVQIFTDTVVQAIEWRPGRANILTRSAQGTVSAPRILITLPLGVLTAQSGEPGRVRFSPELPIAKTRAIQQLEMGRVLRISLRFRTRFWETLSDTRNSSKTLANMSFLLSEDEWFPTWWTYFPRKVPLITGWAPFQCADRLQGMSRAAITERSVRSLASLLRVGFDRLAQELVDAYFHDWQSDPYSRGAYSYGAVGSDGAQGELAKPIENTLFFAGEATDVTGHNGTVHGALASGARATQEILRSSG